jgi:hypothetical protein
MKSMNHLNKVLLVSLLALPFTSSNFLAGDESSVSSEVISKPSLVSRVYNNMSCVYDNKAVNAVTTRVAQHPVVTSLVAGSLATVIGKGLYDRLPTVSSVSSKAKTCGSYLLSGTKKAYDSCVSGAKACGSAIKNHKLASGLIGGGATAGLVALDFWKKPMGNNPISATIARGLLSWLNNHRHPVVIGTAAATGLGGLGLWGGSRLIGGVAEKQAAKPSVEDLPKIAAVKQNGTTNGQDDAGQQTTLAPQTSAPVTTQVRNQSQPAQQPRNPYIITRGGGAHDIRTCSCPFCTAEKSVRLPQIEAKLRQK